MSDDEYHVYFYKTRSTLSEEAPKAQAIPFVAPKERPSRIGAIALEEGALTPEQVSLLLRHLPLEITDVDGMGEALYANHPGSEGLISAAGDDIAAFKGGAHDTVDTWFISGDEICHRRNVAIRDDGGDYRGTLLTSQEVSAIRALVDKRRLLAWK